MPAPTPAKQVLNRAEALQGLRATIEMAFGCHHVAHGHGQLSAGRAVGGRDARAMAAADKAGPGRD